MTTDAIPVFKPNQALTANHLNALREFLDEQDRLTRRTLVGIGVMCGFHLDVDSEAGVLISKGVAVTSEGYLMAEDAVVWLVQALGDPHVGVRAGAAGGLGGLGPVARSAVPALTRALGDEHRFVRSWAAMALSEIGPAAEPAMP